MSIGGMGFESYLSKKITLNSNVDLGKIKLFPKSNSLKEVAITASKPLVQQFYDKTVVNVAGNITATEKTALDVMKKSFGISIGKDDNIAMAGRQGVLVMIDRKLIPMTGQDLATLLRKMSADQIDKIELITNRSAKFDAQGNAGVIDLRLKKDARPGTNGSVTGS